MGQPPQLFSPPAAERAPLPNALSATAVVAYARCPRQCYWTTIDPRRRQASSAALLGSQVHRWIERLARRQPALFDHDEPTETPTDFDATTFERLQAAFRATPFADLDPIAVESAFVLPINSRSIRGRVDAVYERDDRIELVDFKTGRAPHADDPATGVQLDVYALAAVDVWRYDVDRLRTTYCYLESGALISRDLDASMLGSVRARIGAYVDAFGSGDFAANPGGWCARCDFLEICPAGERRAR